MGRWSRIGHDATSSRWTQQQAVTAAWHGGLPSGGCASPRASGGSMRGRRPSDGRSASSTTAGPPLSRGSAMPLEQPLLPAGPAPRRGRRQPRHGDARLRDDAGEEVFTYAARWMAAFVGTLTALGVRHGGRVVIHTSARPASLWAATSRPRVLDRHRRRKTHPPKVSNEPMRHVRSSLNADERIVRRGSSARSVVPRWT